jgi:hypothetical protein
VLIDPVADRLLRRFASLETVGATPGGEGLMDVYDDTPAILRRYSMAELLDEPCDFEWLVGGMLAQPTYGMAAGEEKTLKSYLAAFISVGLASGVPIFGQFAPPEARTVVSFVGEGGRKLYTRRIRRICSAMGVEPRDLDLHPIFDVAPILSPVFQTSLQHHIDELKPGLITLDPLYTFHGTTANASNLHQEGALLNQLSMPCMDAGASLLVVNHMNQTGSGVSLKRITMSGGGEWSDSWLLIAHREAPDVLAGSFKLRLEIGSRQWGGSAWNLDLSIGRFDEVGGAHDGDIHWDLIPNNGSGPKPQTRGGRGVVAEITIRDLLSARPWSFTKNELKAQVGGSREVFDTAFSRLVRSGQIESRQLPHQEAGTTRKRPLWGWVPTRADQNRQCATEEGG